MQEDGLLSGSVADNIAFFDSSFDHHKMIKCAEMAEIHEDLMAMPMTYNSLVGDMGSSLSSGQKQRVLLARALYRQPRILFLDEASAHLDVKAERRIYENLRSLKITKVCIAHRPGVLAYADNIFSLEGMQASPGPPRLQGSRRPQDAVAAAGTR